GPTPDRRAQPEALRPRTQQERPRHESSIAPQPVDPDCRSTPGRMSHVADGRQQRRISHRGPDTEADRPDRPDGKALPDGNHSKGDRLDGKPAGDQSLAADSIGERARTHLAEGPDKRVKSDKRADLDERQPSLSEEQGKQSPSHAVIQVVGQTSRAARGKRPLTEARFDEDLAHRDSRLPAAAVSPTTFVTGMAARLAHQENRETKSETRVTQT